MDKRKKLKDHFLIIGFTIVLIVVISFAGNVIVMRNIFVKNTETYLDRTHAQTLENIENYLQGIENSLFSMCYSPSVQQFLKETDPAARITRFSDVQSVFSNTSYLNSEVLGFSIYDESGEFVTANGSSFQVITHRDFIDIPLDYQYDTAYPPNPYIGNSMSGYTLTIPIIESGNGIISKRTIGAIVFTLSLSHIENQINAGDLYAGSGIALLTGDGNMLAQSGVYTADGALMDESPVGRTGWTLVTSYETGILADDMNTVWQITILTAALILAFILVSLFLIYRHILSPIARASKFMLGVSSDPDNAVVIPMLNAYEELATMVESMNQLLLSLHEKTKELVANEKRSMETEIEKNRLEILAYRSQINPHFLYNTLDCISGMAFRYDAPEIVEISQALSGMFRYAIKGQDFVAVEEELNHLREYATITNHRFAGRISIRIDESKEVRRLRIPRLILQPIVENAVFHGLEKKMGPGEIDVLVRAEGKSLKMTVSDNGLGMPQERIDLILSANDHPAQEDAFTGKSGIGLSNISHRMRLFYQDRAAICVTSIEGAGTTVEIILPIEREGASSCIE